MGYYILRKNEEVIKGWMDRSFKEEVHNEEEENWMNGQRWKRDGEIYLEKNGLL